MTKHIDTYYKVIAGGEVHIFPTPSKAKDFALRFSVGRKDITLGFQVTEMQYFDRTLGKELPKCQRKTEILAFAVLGRRDIDTIGGLINYDTKCDF